jgi:hypothetical protein
MIIRSLPNSWVIRPTRLMKIVDVSQPSTSMPSSPIPRRTPETNSPLNVLLDELRRHPECSEDQVR